MMRVMAIALAAAMAACSPPAQTSDETPVPVEGVPHAAEAPADVLAVIRAEDPQFTPSESEEDATTGARTFEVTGAGASGEVSYSVMHFNEGWRIVSVRREIAWADAPASVRAAANTATPTRVEEVREPGADGIMYDLFGGEPESLLMTVRDVDGQAAVMPAPH